MSKHLIKIKKDKKIYSIQAGWDNPMSQYYLVVFDVANDNENLVYSNIDDPKAFMTGVEFSYFEDVLKDLDVVLPQDMIESIRQDKTELTVNKIRQYYL